MKIQVWNAFASNNSGSYTIVGSFRDASLAARAADLLKPILVAHTQWYDDDCSRPITESPLARFAVAQGLPVDCVDNDWPQYGESNVPQIAALEWQLLIHHSYTASMPRFFGHWIYALGGRVVSEIEHAHAPLVVVCEMRIYRSGDIEQMAGALVNDLRAAEAAFRAHLLQSSSVRITGGEDVWTVRLTAFFADVVAGCAAVRVLADAHGANLHINIRESEGDHDLAGGASAAV
jgi:hypothetical protein